MSVLGKNSFHGRMVTLVFACFWLISCGGAGSDNGDGGEDALAPLMVPAYPSMNLKSIANTTWSSCEWDKDESAYLFRIWRFRFGGAYNQASAEIEGTWHADTDTDCSETSIGSIGRTAYVPLESYGLVAVQGWRDADGLESTNSGAPAASDSLGMLPGQPDARRARFLFKSHYGMGPVSLGGLYQVLFLDESSADTILYIGSPSGSTDAEGFPQYLNDFGALTPYVE